MAIRSSVFSSSDALSYADLNSLAGQWNSFTPTIGGMTQGNGTAIGRYLQFGYLVICRMQFTFGSTSSAGASYCSFSLPLAAASSPMQVPSGYAYLTTTRYPLGGYLSGSVCYMYPLSGGTWASFGSFGSSAPGTWVSGDTVYASCLYEATL